MSINLRIASDLGKLLCRMHHPDRLIAKRVPVPTVLRESALDQIRRQSKFPPEIVCRDSRKQPGVSVVGVRGRPLGYNGDHLIAPFRLGGEPNYSVPSGLPESGLFQGRPLLPEPISTEFGFTESPAEEAHAHLLDLPPRDLARFLSALYQDGDKLLVEHWSPTPQEQRGQRVDTFVVARLERPSGVGFEVRNKTSLMWRPPSQEKAALEYQPSITNWQLTAYLTDRDDYDDPRAWAVLEQGAIDFLLPHLNGETLLAAQEIFVGFPALRFRLEEKAPIYPTVEKAVGFGGDWTLPGEKIAHEGRPPHIRERLAVDT